MKGKICLSEAELKLVPSSFDIVGDILIFADFPEELKKKERVVGDLFLKRLKNIRVVCRKTKQYSGVYRTPKLKIIAGARRKVATYRENNCVMRLDIEKCYFSPRLGNERKRIASLVKPEEKILVMFSGVAPYPLVISKNSKAKVIYGVEMNPVAHKFAEENVKLNNRKNIKLLRGDVRTVVPKIRVKFDRVLMPLPRGAENFLDLAISKLKKRGMLHFYDFLEQDKLEGAKTKVVEACDKARRKCKVINIVKCGQYGPRKLRICVDALIY